MKRITLMLCSILLIVLFCIACCSCKKETTIDKVHSAVTLKACAAYCYLTIGGNELKSSKATITNIEQTSTYMYRVSGKMEMTNIYGVRYYNYYDVSVSYRPDTDRCTVGAFNYQSDNWKRI